MARRLERFIAEREGNAPSSVCTVISGGIMMSLQTLGALAYDRDCSPLDRIGGHL